MRTNHSKTILKAAVRILGILPFAAVVALGQQQVNLTAGPAATALPDGSTVPMWGYSCAGATVITGSTATCALLNPAAVGATVTLNCTATVLPAWSPVVITVPSGQGLTINLTNGLTFLSGNSVPTSLAIMGQCLSPRNRPFALR